MAAALACWTKRVPFGTYNVTNPGKVTTREVVELIRRSGVCTKEFEFFASESEFMMAAAKTPRSNCVLDCVEAGVGRDPPDRGPRGRRARPARLEEGRLGAP